LEGRTLDEVHREYQPWGHAGDGPIQGRQVGRESSAVSQCQTQSVNSTRLHRSHPLTGLCQEAIVFRRNPSVVAFTFQAQLPATRLPADSNRTRFLALLAANRIAPATHQVQACRDLLRPPWRHWPPQRNVGTKPCPRG
jgi:hypothetical protein